MEQAKGRKSRILITDDSEMNREILKEMLSDSYEIIEAENGQQAVDIIEKIGSTIDLMLLDIVMPVMDGFEVLAVMNHRRWIDSLPVIMISAETASSYINRAYDLGISDYITRPFDISVVLHRVNNTMMLFSKQKKLIELVSEQIYEKQKSSNMMVSILSHIVEFRNGESGLHVLHVNTMTEILLNTLAKKTNAYDLTDNQIQIISMASSLHDIGKISIPAEILNKPGRLTSEEFEIMKTHSAIGAQMLDTIPYNHDEPLIKAAYEICRWHHERYDGRGYPDGLKGDEIPISAQIVSIADVYDALTSERVYKPAFSHEKAMEMILNEECGSFNPLVLACLQECSEEIQRELRLVSNGRRSEMQIKNTSIEVLRKNNIVGNGYAPKEKLWDRNQEMAQMLREFHFQYTADAHILNITSAGESMYGFNCVTATDAQWEELEQMISKPVLEDVWADCLKTTPQNPLVDKMFYIVLQGVKHHFRLICRTVWGALMEPTIVSVIGAMFELTD